MTFDDIGTDRTNLKLFKNSEERRKEGHNERIKEGHTQERTD